MLSKGQNIEKLRESEVDREQRKMKKIRDDNWIVIKRWLIIIMITEISETKLDKRKTLTDKEIEVFSFF